MNAFPRWYVILCYLAVPISGVGVDIYTPSLPSIMQYFHTSATMAQLSLSVYLLGFGLAQLFAGPITDRYGRKPVLLLSLAVFVVLCFLIAHSTNPWELLSGRLLQGIAGAGMSVPVRAILADISDQETYKKRINYMVFAWGMGPILAPWIGSHLQHAFGWQACFYFLAVYGLITIAMTLIIKETHTNRQTHKDNPLLTNYKILFRTRFFIPAMIFTGLIYSMMISFGIIGPFLVEVKLKFSVLVFGRCALLMGVAWVLGSLCNRLLIHVDLKMKSYIALAAMTVVMIFMGVESHIHPNSLWLFVVPVAVFILLAATCFSAQVTHILSYFQNLAGSANAALFAGVWFTSGIVASIVSHLDLHATALFALLLLVITICAVISFSTAVLLEKPAS